MADHETAPTPEHVAPALHDAVAYLEIPLSLTSAEVNADVEAELARELHSFLSSVSPTRASAAEGAPRILCG